MKTSARKKQPPTQSQQLQKTLDDIKSNPDSAAILEAYENLRSMGTLQAIQNQLPTVPVLEVFSTSVAC